MFAVGETRPLFITGVLLPAITDFFAPVVDAIDDSEQEFAEAIGQRDIPVADHPDHESLSLLVNDMRDLEQARNQILAGNQTITISLRRGPLVLEQEHIDLGRQILEATLWELDGTDEQGWQAAVGDINDENRQQVEAAVYLLMPRAQRLHLMARYHNSSAIAAVFNNDVGLVREREELWRHYHAEAPHLTHGEFRDRGARTYGFIQRVDLSETSAQVTFGAMAVGVMITCIVVGPSVAGYGLILVSGGLALSGAYNVGTAELAADRVTTDCERQQLLMQSGAGLHDLCFGLAGIVGGISMVNGTPPTSGPRTAVWPRIVNAWHVIDDWARNTAPVEEVVMVGTNGERLGMLVPRRRGNSFMVCNGAATSLPENWQTLRRLTVVANEEAPAAAMHNPNLAEMSLPRRIDFLLAIEDEIQATRGLQRQLQMNGARVFNLNRVRHGSNLSRTEVLNNLIAEIQSSEQMPAIIASSPEDIAWVMQSVEALSSGRSSGIALCDFNLGAFSKNGAEIARALVRHNFTAIGMSDTPSCNATIINEGGAAMAFEKSQAITTVISNIFQ